jgi:hypothetical protein
MSVATQLGLDPASTPFVELEQNWACWVDQFPRLARAGDLRSLRGWLAAAEPAEADEVLHTLATLGSPSGADDLAAASVLAWALLPGACALAHRLHGLSPRIDELVAAQLWLEIRSFPWHRLHKVAANILANTRAGVLGECGARSQTKRADKAWTNTRVVDPAASFWNRHTAGLDAVPSAADELLALLDSASAANIITDADTGLLLSLVEAAERCGTTRTGRGNAGLMSNTASAQVAVQAGLSPITVRRRARRIIDALAAAHTDLQAAA